MQKSDHFRIPRLKGMLKPALMTTSAALLAIPAGSAFAAGGTVTAGNSSQTTDGAAATVVMSEDMVKKLGVKPIAKLKLYTTVGCRSDEMGVGPRYAIPKLLEEAGMSIGDIGLFEINEAFASVVLAWQKETGADMSKVNINGGAIALGHPLGATGARLMTTLLNELERTGGRYGLQTMCEGGGQANVTIIERLD